VPLSALVDVDNSKVGPLSVTHQAQFPSVTLTFNLKSGVALGQAVEAITRAAAELGMPPSVLASFQGDAQAFQASLATMPVLILAATLVVYLILGILYESYIHPLTILSTLPSAGVGALLALQVGKMDLSVIGIIGIILLIGIVKKNGIILVDFAISATRECAMSAHDAIRQTAPDHGRIRRHVYTGRRQGDPSCRRLMGTRFARATMKSAFTSSKATSSLSRRHQTRISMARKVGCLLYGKR
jgi:multidrug efflux pump subunit AcrB